ncbi:MAG TPA: EamA family transporter [Chthoniobacterales bacterium]|nr:EamA family transporter [Chthoniobacterales bacterium]
MPEKRANLAAAAAFVALCLIWSSTWLAIKLGLRDLPPVSFVAIRFVIAVAVLLAISVGRVRLIPPDRGDFKLLAWTGVLMFCINYALLFWAELYVSSGLSAVLQATIPIFGMVLAHFIIPNEPLRGARIAGALVALGGVAVICSRLFDFGGLLAFWGGVAIVFGAASAAFSNVVLKARAIRLAPAMIAAWQMIFGLVPLIIGGFLLEGNPLQFHWTPRAVFCLFYLAIPGSAIAFLLLYWLLPRMSVTNLQTISFITPPGAVLFGWLLGGESFSLWSLMGGALVLIGVWLIFRKAKPVEMKECETALPQG